MIFVRKKSSKRNTTYNYLHMYVSIAGMKIRKQLILENSISQDDKQALPSILEYLKEVAIGEFFLHYLWDNQIKGKNSIEMCS